jgi:hypothetical protein
MQCLCVLPPHPVSLCGRRRDTHEPENIRLMRVVLLALSRLGHLPFSRRIPLRQTNSDFYAAFSKKDIELMGSVWLKSPTVQVREGGRGKNAALSDGMGKGIGVRFAGEGKGRQSGAGGWKVEQEGAQRARRLYYPLDH